MKILRFARLSFGGALALAAASLLALAGCAATPATPTTPAYSLSAAEKAAAFATAQTYFRQHFAYPYPEAPITLEPGLALSCKPVDANSNGLVECRGRVPFGDGIRKEVSVFCAYKSTAGACRGSDVATS